MALIAESFGSVRIFVMSASVSRLVLIFAVFLRFSL
jgi:hypothetical protein